MHGFVRPYAYQPLYASYHRITCLSRAANKKTPSGVFLSLILAAIPPLLPHTACASPSQCLGLGACRWRGSAGLVRAALSAPINRAGEPGKGSLALTGGAYKIRILYNCQGQLAALPGLQNSSILYNWASLLRRAHLRGSLREPPAWSAKGSGLRPRLRKKAAST